MKKPLLLGLLLVLAGCGGAGKVSVSDQDKAVSAAMLIYHQDQESGKDLNSGPCIAEQLPGLPDWAADVAHDPRQPVDNQPANQCSSFQAGQTHHFVELTPEGQLIRTR